ncbi:class I SAM-dependent methyltransferase [Candidatus Microgenomates bacterium]|nr:class I SAM-dependent methyltransferase [Candidatus Microgenomates bacterium]
MKIVKDIQSAFFDHGEHQYNPELILHPPYHCIVEYDYLRRHLPKSGSIADYGAGSGRMTIPSLQNGYNVTAIDISNQSLANLKAVAKQLHLSGLSTASELPRRETFDAIIGADVLHHVEIDRELPKMYASLKKGGRIVFSAPSAYNLAWYLYLPFASSWSVERGMLQCRLGNLVALCKKHGFKNVSVTGMGLLPTPLFNTVHPIGDLNYRLGNLPVLKIAAYRYLLSAQK